MSTVCLFDKQMSESAAEDWIDRLETENAELKQKLFKAETERGVMFEEYDKQTATIEALQLRIARLVDALNSISATTGEYLLFTAKSTDLSKEYHKARKSLSAEGDQQWLREKQAELTEAAIDAPRGFFMGLELGCKDLESMRAHLDRCGYDYSCWPAWAKEETGHITKAGKAILVFTMMASELRQQKEVKP